MTEAHTQRAHARLSPSGAYRWMSCPGSVRLEADLPDRRTSFADEGTAAHELAATCVKGGLVPEHFLGGSVDIDTGKVYREEGHGIDIDEEMVEGVRTYLQWTLCFGSLDGWERIVEERVSLAYLGVEGMDGGTADFMAYHPETRRLVVGDFKYGRGHAVEPEENPQAMSYALGASARFHNRGIDHIEVVIVQPRAPHPKGPVRAWYGTIVDLAEFAGILVTAARATAEPDAPLRAGEWCKFCKAAPTCPAIRTKALDAAMVDFDDTHEISAPDPTTGTPEDLARVLHEVDFIEMWCRRLREHAHAEATEGRVPPGWKLVQKRATRKWKDPLAAEATLSEMIPDDELFTRKLITPAGAEKFMPGKNKEQRAKALLALTFKESSGTVLAPIDDPRAPANPGAAAEFA